MKKEITRTFTKRMFVANWMALVGLSGIAMWSETPLDRAPLLAAFGLWGTINLFIYSYFGHKDFDVAMRHKLPEIISDAVKKDYVAAAVGAGSLISSALPASTSSDPAAPQTQAVATVVGKSQYNGEE